jgi:hypothetical protein
MFDLSANNRKDHVKRKTRSVNNSWARNLFSRKTTDGAREHNLKNIDVTIPRDKLVVITDWRSWGRHSLPE